MNIEDAKELFMDVQKAQREWKTAISYQQNAKRRVKHFGQKIPKLRDYFMEKFEEYGNYLKG